MITNIIITVLAIGLLVAVFIKDFETKYIKQHPVRFTLELIISISLAVLGFLLLSYLRGWHNTKKMGYYLLVVGLRVVVIHLFLQFSGLYKRLFSVG